MADWRELDWGEAPTSSSTNDLIFSGVTLGKNPNNGSSGFLVGSITFAADAGAFTLVNLPFTLNGNLTNNCSTEGSLLQFAQALPEALSWRRRME